MYDRAGNTVNRNDIVPLAMRYIILADHHWDIDNPYRDDSVTYQGEASATLSAEQIVRDRDLLGHVARLDRAPRVEQARTGCMSEQEYYALLGEDEAGRYRLTISFPPSPAAYARAHYRGIVRGGGAPVRGGGGPDHDFLGGIPGFMPNGLNVVGRLRSPDQAEVRGDLCFVMDQKWSGYEWATPERITISWSFTRTRR